MQRTMRRLVAVVIGCSMVASLALGCGTGPEFANTDDAGISDDSNDESSDANSDEDGQSEGDAGDMTDGDDQTDSDSNDNGEVTGEIDLDIPDDKQVGQLSRSEQTDACRAADELARQNTTTEDVCLWATHFQTSLEGPESDDAAVSTCEDQYQAWLDEEEAGGFDDQCDQIGGAKECSATVGEMKACQRALIGEFVDYVNNLPACTDVTANYYENDYRPFSPKSSNGIDDPEACAPFRDSCPEFYENWMGPIKFP